MSYTAAETGRVKSIKSKFENLNSLESLDISTTVPHKYRKPSAKFLFKRSSTSIDLPINRIAVTAAANANNPNVRRANDKSISMHLQTQCIDTKSYLRRHNNLDRTTSVDTFCVKKRNLIGSGEDTIKPLKEIKENVEVRLARHTNDPVKRSSIKRSPAFRVGDKSNTNNANLNNNNNSSSGGGGGGGDGGSNSSKNLFSNKTSNSKIDNKKSTLNNNNINNSKNNHNNSGKKVNTMKVPPLVPSEFAEKFENFLKRCDIETKQDLQEPGLSDTLKAFLRQPLPSGPPPKKPPRTFIDSPKPQQNRTDSNASDDEKITTTTATGTVLQQRHSPVHGGQSSNDMKQKIDLLENQLNLKAQNHKFKSNKTSMSKEKSPFSSSLLNCIPCSSASIYDTMTIGPNQFGKVATTATVMTSIPTSKEKSPEKCTKPTTTSFTSSSSSSLSHRQSATRTNSEPIYMEPFAHLKHTNASKIVNGTSTNSHSKTFCCNNSNSFSVSSPIPCHLNTEPKLSTSTMSSNGSFDGPESLGSSLTSCTSCTADSITDLHDIHYMCTSIENKLKSSDSDSISNETDPPIALSNTYDEINSLVNAAFGQHKQTSDTMGNTIDSATAPSPSSISHSSSMSSPIGGEPQQKSIIKLSRTLTEKRKDYVRRVSAVKQIPDLLNDSTHQTFKPSVFRTFSVDNTDDAISHSDSINGNCSKRTGSPSTMDDKRRSDEDDSDDRTIDRNCNMSLSSSAEVRKSDDNVDIVDVDSSDRAIAYDENNENAPKLFQVCLLIGFNNSTRQAYIKSKFPADEDVPPNIEQLVFPSPNLINQTRKNQDYSIILTDNNGYHIYGYCRRVLPESCEICLPLAYCIISEVKAPGFYFKILKEIETRHGAAEFQTTFLLQSLQTRSIPCAGKFLHIKLPLSPRPKTISTSHHKMVPKRLSLEVNPKWLTESAAQAAFSNCEHTQTDSTIKKERSSPKSLVQEFEEKKQLNNGGAPFDLSLINRSLFSGKNPAKCDEILIRRPNDLRLESTELSDLYQALGPDLLIVVFSSLLLERKVILYTKNISILSSCVLGLQTLLYPFQWQHTIITILPESLVDICQAPIPVLAGLLGPITFEIEDGIVIDLDQRALVQKCGDETTILPSALSHSLKVSLEMVDLLDQGKMLSSVLIAEAFLRCFVEIFVGYKHKHFDKKLFIESHSSQSYRLFLEWFVETAMFRHFVHQKFATNDNNNALNTSWMGESKFYDLFDSRILKSENESSSTQQNMEIIMKNCKVINKKAKTFKDRFKDFISSNSNQH